MALEITSLAVDSEKAREGTWVEYMGGRFKIARFTHPEADMARRQVQLKFYEHLQAVNLEDSKGQDKANKAAEDYKTEMARVMAEHILVDWENLTERGESMPYSQEKAFELLNHANYYEFYQFVFDQSVKHDNYSLPQDVVANDVKTSAEA